MARASNDALRRWETSLLWIGAIASASLLAWNARDAWVHLQGTQFQAMSLGFYGAKLLMLESALIAPFIVLSLLGNALLRETQRATYRIAGLTISFAASAGVFAMLLLGLIPVHLTDAIDRLMAAVVPALLFLAVCAGLYGALVWLAQHGRLDSVMDGRAPSATHRRRD